VFVSTRVLLSLSAIAVRARNGRKLTALLLRLDVRLVVPLHAVEELLPALGVPDVLDAEVDALLNVAVPDDLVHNDTDGGGRHVVDDACPAVGVYG
jgi:hypothetical protein